MAHLALLWKARTIEKYRLKYEKEKLNSIKITNAQNTQIQTKTLYQRFCYMNYENTKTRISKTFLRYYPEGSAVYNFFYLLKTDQTFPNFLMKSLIGFVGGIVLTYLCFMFFVFQLSISLIHATIMSSIIGVLLTLGLAFSYRIRCLVFLLIPQFFSRVGRYTLTCYALVLILTGPATNTLKNSEVLSESLACAQEQIKRSAYQINQSIKRPYNSLKDSISMIAAGIKQLAAKIKMMTLNLSRLTLSIAHSLQSSYSWLNTVVDSCNRHLGTPYDHCSQTVQQSVADCQAVLGSWSSWLCDTAKLMQLACQPVKPLPEFCHVLEYANGNILDVVKKHLNTFIERVNSMLYLEIHVHHSYSFSNNATNSANQVAAGIVTEIRNKADMMLTWLSWSSCVTSLSLLLIIFRAKYYQNMYETRSRFDNRYITKELIDLDLKRLRHGKETVLPLNKREESKYIKTSSFRLVSSERVHLSRSAVTMVITTFKLLIHMVADYSLYWVLMTIRHHGLRQTPLKPGSPNAGIHVSGSTLISKILASLVETITLPLATPPPSIMTCLPNPRTPDFHRYLQIGILIFLLWFFALFEPYGLRLRHIIMGLYRPERAKARAVWLLNHIQRTRGSFLKFARRKLHREFKYSTERRHTFQRWLQDHIPCDLLKRFLGIYPDDFHCVLCGVIEECNECDGSHVSCETPGCPGVYCTKCYSDVGHLCTICLSPADYGDLSDVSLVKDSSEESDDEEFKCCKYFGRRKKYDDENPGPSKHQPQGNRRYAIFRDKNLNKESISKNNSKEPEEYPLLEREEEDDTPKTNERKLSKAMMVRHKRYTDFDLQNKRHVISLGEDTSCLACQIHCEDCAIIEPVNSKINEVQTDMRCILHDEKANQIENHYKTEYLNIRDQDDAYNYDGILQSKETNLEKIKHNLSINGSLAKTEQNFKQICKHDLNRRRNSHTTIKTKRNRGLVFKLSCFSKFRLSGGKRKRRLRTLLRSTCFIFQCIVFLISLSTPKMFYLHNTRSSKRRLTTNRRLRVYKYEHEIIQIFHNVPKISLTAVVKHESNMDKCLDIYFGFYIRASGTYIYSPENYSYKMCMGVGDHNVVQKQDPLKIKDDKENKISVISKTGECNRKAGKFRGIFTCCLKVKRIFAPCGKYFKRSKKDQVPKSIDTTNHKKRKKSGSIEKNTSTNLNYNKDTTNHEKREMTVISEEKCCTRMNKNYDTANHKKIIQFDSSDSSESISRPNKHYNHDTKRKDEMPKSIDTKNHKKRKKSDFTCCFKIKRIFAPCGKCFKRSKKDQVPKSIDTTNHKKRKKSNSLEKVTSTSKHDNRDTTNHEKREMSVISEEKCCTRMNKNYDTTNHKKRIQFDSSDSSESISHPNQHYKHDTKRKYEMPKSIDTKNHKERKKSDFTCCFKIKRIFAPCGKCFKRSKKDQVSKSIDNTNHKKRKNSASNEKNTSTNKNANKHITNHEKGEMSVISEEKCCTRMNKNYETTIQFDSSDSSESIRRPNKHYNHDNMSHEKRRPCGCPEKIRRASKNDNEATRKYRLMTYLNEQDWMNERCADLKTKLAASQNVCNAVDDLPGYDDNQVNPDADDDEEIPYSEDDDEFEPNKYCSRTTVRSDEDMYDMFDYDNINYNQKVSRIIKKTETAKDSLTKLRKECKYKYEIGLNQSKNEDSYPSFERCENINLLRIKKPKNKSKKEAMLPKKRSILKKSSDKKKVKSNKEVTYEDFEEICKMDAAVEVHPFVADNFCQYMPIQDETTQAIVLKDQSQCMSQHSECMIKDFLKTLARRFFAFGVEEDEAIESKTQNNATQHTYSVRNVAIYSRQHAKRKLHKEASTIHFNALKAEVDGETMTIQNHTQSTAAQCYIFSPILYTDSCVAQDLVKDFNLGDVPVFDTLQKRKFDKTKYEDNEHTDKEHNIPEQPHKYLKQINQQLSVDEILPELKSPGRQPEKHTQYLKQINQKMAVDEILPEFKPTEPLPLKQKPFKYMKQISQKPAVHDILPEFSPPELVGPENTWNYSREGIEHKPHPQHLTTDTSSSLDVFQSLSSLLRTDSRNFLDSCSDDDESEEVDDDKTTDTTVYTMTNLEYGSPRRNKLEKLRQSVVTKSNMATATETTKSCDIGTVTSDWWSPMLERKSKRLTLAKKGVQVLAEDQKILQDRCVGTSARVVTFNSVARIIPSLRTHLNLMSPSRYLLESQRYYNELFLVNYPLESGYDEQYFAESRFSSHRCHVLKRKGYNEKRSEESYIKLYNPFAETWPAKTVQRNPWVTANRGKKRYPATRYKGGWRTKGVTKTKYTTRLGVRKPEIKVKSGEVCLLARPYLSTDSISLDNHHHSLTETGNF